ncbi:MAG: hypothetical protein HY744_31165 [Deltaproteobacteria bacterium]|nr:hypothetical protein [Deltaproteobacteria bacterium]
MDHRSGNGGPEAGRMPGGPEPRLVGAVGARSLFALALLALAACGPGAAGELLDVGGRRSGRSPRTGAHVGGYGRPRLPPAAA